MVTDDGAELGPGVGIVDGNGDGMWVGKTVGDGEGLRDGNPVGTRLGFAVGDLVGRSDYVHSTVILCFRRYEN